MLKFRMHVVSVFPAVSLQVALKLCVAAKNRKQSRNVPILGVCGRSRSSMLVSLDSSSALVVIISSTSVPICKRFFALDESIMVK